MTSVSSTELYRGHPGSVRSLGASLALCLVSAEDGKLLSLLYLSYCIKYLNGIFEALSSLYLSPKPLLMDCKSKSTECDGSEVRHKRSLCDNGDLF